MQEVRHRLLLHTHIEPQRPQGIEKQRLELFLAESLLEKLLLHSEHSKYFNTSVYLILCLMNGKITCTIPIG